MVRDRKLVLFRLWGLLRVQVVILFLVQNVEPRFSFPSILVVHFSLLCDFIIVDAREGKRKVVLCVSVKVAVISGDRLTKLLFLELPDVKLLTGVGEHFDTSGQVDTRLGESATAHALKNGLVRLKEIHAHRATTLVHG